MTDRRFAPSRPWWSLSLAVLSALLPSMALAHPGPGAVHGFGSGFAHPFFGWDHLLAMVAVGIWAGQRGGRALWLLPALFVSAMAFGGGLGAMGVGLAGVEAGILASVLVLGVLIAASARVPLVAAGGLVVLFALFHGHAHGTEMPLSHSGLAYGAGFCAATALLHGAGILLPAVLRRVAGEQRLAWVRLSGAAIGLAGLALIAF